MLYFQRKLKQYFFAITCKCTAYLIYKIIFLFRQYLSNEGFGYGNPFQRQKQYQQIKAMKASHSVTEHKVNKLTEKYETQLAVQNADKKKAKKHLTKNAMERLVEDLISESMANGDFDNLSGAGKPLPERVINNN